MDSFSRSSGAHASKTSGKPVSLAFGSSRPKSVVPNKRPRAALTEDSDPEDEERTRTQVVTGFENGGAVGESASASKDGRKEPLVIPVQKDASWRSAGNFRKKGKNLLPAEAQAQQSEKHGGDRDEDEEKKPQYGLVVKQRSEELTDAELSGSPLAHDKGEADELAKPQTLDDEAYSRLLNGDEKKSSLVIPQTGPDSEDMDWTGHGTTNNFHDDIAARPDQSTLADYEAVPIEDFGAAILRGMGYKEGDAIGRGNKGKKEAKPKVLERRQNLQGIGAKEAATDIPELGAWGKGAKDNKGKYRGPKTREVYNPVVMRNSKTGEILTEEEVKQKQKKQEAKAEEIRRKEEDRDWRDRRDRDSRHKRESRDDRPDRGSDDRRRKDPSEARHYRGERRDRDDDEDRRSRRHRRDRRDYGNDDNDDEDDRYSDRRERRRQKDESDDRYDSPRRSRSPKRRARSREDEKPRRYRHRDDHDERRDRRRDKYRDDYR